MNWKQVIINDMYIIFDIGGTNTRVAASRLEISGNWLDPASKLLAIDGIQAMHEGLKSYPRRTDIRQAHEAHTHTHTHNTSKHTHTHTHILIFTHIIHITHTHTHYTHTHIHTYYYTYHIHTYIHTLEIAKQDRDCRSEVITAWLGWSQHHVRYCCAIGTSACLENDTWARWSGQEFIAEEAEDTKLWRIILLLVQGWRSWVHWWLALIWLGLALSRDTKSLVLTEVFRN